VHHIRALKDLNPKGRKQQPEWAHGWPNAADAMETGTAVKVVSKSSAIAHDIVAVP
jgi:hypothetical protein